MPLSASVKPPILSRRGKKVFTTMPRKSGHTISPPGTRFMVFQIFMIRLFESQKRTQWSRTRGREAIRPAVDRATDAGPANGQERVLPAVTLGQVATVAVPAEDLPGHRRVAGGKRQ